MCSAKEILQITIRDLCNVVWTDGLLVTLFALAVSLSQSLEQMKTIFPLCRVVNRNDAELEK